MLDPMACPGILDLGSAVLVLPPPGPAGSCLGSGGPLGPVGPGPGAMYWLAELGPCVGGSDPKELGFPIPSVGQTFNS